MAVAARLRRYMEEQEIGWNAVEHRRSSCGLDAAHHAHVPPGELAKAVLLADNYGYLVAVVPADRRVPMATIRAALGRELQLASEAEVARLFPDCDPGAIPPVGEAYGIATVWDASLAGKGDVYFEGGDHVTLVQVTGNEFASLMRAADRIPEGEAVA